MASDDNPIVINAGVFAHKVQDVEPAHNWLARHTLDVDDVLLVHSDGSISVHGGGNLNSVVELETFTTLENASDIDPYGTAFVREEWL